MGRQRHNRSKPSKTAQSDSFSPRATAKFRQTVINHVVVNTAIQLNVSHALETSVATHKSQQRMINIEGPGPKKYSKTSTATIMHSLPFKKSQMS